MRKNIFLLLILVAAFAIIPGIIQAASYYISNDGDDSNNGLSPDNPWQTIGKVNTEMNGGVINQGDDIYFKRGDDFSDTGLLARIGGISSDWMIIGAYGSGADPILSGSGWGIDSLAANMGYVRIQDLDIRDRTGGGGIRWRSSNSNDITIYNVDTYNTDSHGIIMDSTNRYRVESCTVTNARGGGIGIYGAPASDPPIRNGIVMNCTVVNAAADGIILHDRKGVDIGANHFLYNNVSSGCVREEGYDITSGTNIYIKDCEAYSNNNRGIVLGHDVERVFLDNFYIHDETGSGGGIVISSAHNSVIRNSIVERIEPGYMTYISSESTDSSWNTNNIIYYNNDFIYYDNSNEVALGRANTVVDHIIFKNNIFHSIYDSAPGLFFDIWNTGTLSSYDVNSTYNIWWRGDGLTGIHWSDGDGSYNFTQWLAKAQVSNDLRVNANMVNPSNGDFTLQSNSPAIDAGTWLTETVGSGSNNQVTVEDAMYFHDGFGLTDGDEIKVGSNNAVMITDINYDTNVITLESSITWSNGDPVSFDYSGNAPDIGAYEYDSGEPTNNPPVLGSIGNQSTDEEELLQFTVTATDPDGDDLTYSASNLPSGASFNVNTQVFSWTPSFAQSGTYSNVCFYVTDGELTDSECITITVNDVCVNCGLGTPSVSPSSPEENQDFTITCPTNNNVYDCIEASADGNNCSFSSWSGNNAIFSCSGLNPGNYLARCQSNTGTSQNCCADEETGSFTVQEPTNNPPVLGSIGNQSTDEEELLQFTVTATDPDGDDLTYSASNLPSGASFNVNTQVFSWTPSFAQSGTYSNVCFQVSDGQLTDSECITITVNDVCTNCNLGTPSVSPSSPETSQSLTVTCPTNDNNHDCINASVSGTQCSFSFWSGNNAVFNCSGLAAGTYTARCQSNTGTGQNCCSDEATRSFSVQEEETLPAPPSVPEEPEEPPPTTGGASTPSEEATTTTEEADIEELKVRIAELVALIAQIQAKITLLRGEATDIPVSYQFNKYLFYGQKGDDIRYLQMFLKSRGSDIYPQGLVTGYFGPLTNQAVINFQLKHRIITSAKGHGAGYIGPKTRAKINSILGK